MFYHPLPPQKKNRNFIPTYISCSGCFHLSPFLALYAYNRVKISALYFLFFIRYIWAIVSWRWAIACIAIVLSTLEYSDVEYFLF